MPRYQLTGGAYTAKNLIAAAQRCVNLVPELNPGPAAQSPVQITYYPRNGLVQSIAGPSKPGRCVYHATDGTLYVVIYDSVYRVSGPVYILLGTINPGSTPVSMADNGATLVIVDGSTDGWWLTLGINVLHTIADSAFYGSTTVAYANSFFSFNRPGTTQWYLSPPDWNGADPFDPLDIANKIGVQDNIAAQVAMKGDVWTVGNLSTEVWFLSGNADFPYEPVNGVLIQQGTIAARSVAAADLSVFWLSANQQGGKIVLMGSNYDAKRISTHAIEAAFDTYGDVSDAVGFTFQLEGHTYYQVNFPSADKSWVYDMASSLWHERTWTDGSGIEHRDRVQSTAFSNGSLYGLDWQNGSLYTLTNAAQTDDGSPIYCRRGFPHLQTGGDLAQYTRFIVDIATGETPGLSTTTQPALSVRWSKDRGHTFGNPITLSFGSSGQYGMFPTVNSLGVARDLIVEVFWNYPAPTALNGAWIELIKAGR